MRNIKTYKMFEAKNTGQLTPEQVEWLDECTKGTWSVNPQTGLVDVDGNFDCNEQNLIDFKGVRFGVVGWNFECSDNKLTSLKGAPQKVGGGFYCYHNNLTSLKGAPRKVEGDFYCYGNNLTSLKGAPQEVGKSFDCSNNNLTSLKGAPQEVRGGFYCYGNNLTSLQGAPQEVGGDFYCDSFQTRDWSIKGWLEILNSGEEGARLILTILSEPEIDKWMKKHPLDLDLLDGHPEIKKGVLARTGLRDTSSIARQIRKGVI